MDLLHVFDGLVSALSIIFDEFGHQRFLPRYFSLDLYLLAPCHYVGFEMLHYYKHYRNRNILPLYLFEPSSKNYTNKGSSTVKVSTKYSKTLSKMIKLSFLYKSSTI